MTSTPSTAQTRGYLMRRFAEAGLHPKTRHGQNFLIDLNLLRLLADSAQIGPDDVVLEVGGGTGSLTELLAARAAHVISVEVDPYMAQLAREQLSDRSNITLLVEDALAGKNRLSSVVMDTVHQRLAEVPGRRFKLAANLPYNIATPLISNLLVSEPLPATLTVTIQKELADRMVAAPGVKDYGALSIWIQCQCRAEIVRVLPPQVFWPRPKVTSAIVHLEVDLQRRAALGDVAWLHTFARQVFCHRRKFLRGELLTMLKHQLSKTAIDEVLAAEGFDPMCRAEQLQVAELVRLAAAFHRRLAVQPTADA